MSLPAALSDYERAVLEARASGLRIAARTLPRLRAIVEVYARRLEIALRNLPPGSRRSRIELAQRINERLARELSDALDDATTNGVRLTAGRVRSIMDRATAQVMREAELPQPIVPRVPLEAAAAFAARRPVAQSFRTLIPLHAAAHARAVDALIAEGLAGGIPQDALARTLRAHITGADDAALAPYIRDGRLDLRRIPKSLQTQARSVAWKAKRIAVTEINQAQRDATLAAMIEAPHVKAARWTLSLVRGPFAREDQCDTLAEIDFYGLGLGVYPLRRWPLEHPNGKCYPRPIYRSRKEWGDEKPDPAQVRGPGDIGLSDAEAGRVTRALGGAGLPVARVAQPALALAPSLTTLPPPPTGSALDRAVMIREAQTRNAAIEHVAAWDQDGRLILEKTGDENSVSFTNTEGNRMFQAAVFTHNHPGGSPMSVDDIMLAMRLEMRRMRAVGMQFGRAVDYDLQLPETHFNLVAFGVDYRNAIELEKTQFRLRHPEYGTGSLNTPQRLTWDELRHETLSQLARLYGMTYTRRFGQ